MTLSSNPCSTFHLGYRPALDGVRGFAVLWVIGFHYNIPLGRDGLFGVDIFFVLSGFLITVLLMEEWELNRHIQLSHFYFRRILRLFPALVAMLIVLSKVAPKEYLFSTLFYFTNWVKALHLQPDSLYLDHAWSLSIEEQFYIVWPITLFVLLRKQFLKKYLFLVPLLLGLFSALARILYWNATQDWFRVYMGTDLHADGLLIGSAFGIMTFYGFLPDFSRHKLVVELVTLLTALLLVFLLIEKQLTQSFVPLYGNFGVSIGTIVIISRLVNYPSTLAVKIFSFAPLVKIGVISYGLYLWHAPIGVIVDRANFALEPSKLVVVKVLITFLTAGLSYWLVEKPFLKLKNRFISNQSTKDSIQKTAEVSNT